MNNDMTADELNLKAREDKRKMDRLTARAKAKRDHDYAVHIPREVQTRLEAVATKRDWTMRALTAALIEHALDDLDKLL